MCVCVCVCVRACVCVCVCIYRWTKSAQPDVDAASAQNQSKSNSLPPMNPAAVKAAAAFGIDQNDQPQLLTAPSPGPFEVSRQRQVRE